MHPIPERPATKPCGRNAPEILEQGSGALTVGSRLKSFLFQSDAGTTASILVYFDDSTTLLKVTVVGVFVISKLSLYNF